MEPITKVVFRKWPKREGGRELESRPYGYRFKVYKRIPRDAISVRRAALPLCLESSR